MYKVCIVVIAYNRLEALKRLLCSLENAQYNEEVDLIISIDKTTLSELYTYSDSIKWQYGKLLIDKRDERLGLRKHVLKCGEYLSKYDALIVLEDDTFVSPDYFNYAIKAIEFYFNDTEVAGISLYSYNFIRTSKIPFTPMHGRSDVYFVNYASSLGEIWLRNQWAAFIKWMNENGDNLRNFSNNLPSELLQWNDNSWLKFHIAYCMLKNKYFVYPYVGLSTNFSDPGVNMTGNSNNVQTLFREGVGYEYKFEHLNSNSIRYDGFFENKDIATWLNIDPNSLCVDLNGKRTDNYQTKYLITTKQLNFRIIKQYKLEMRPHEINVLHGIEGDGIYLYDKFNIIRNKFHNSYKVRRWCYDILGSPWPKGFAVRLVYEKMRNRILGMLKNISK